MKFNKEILLTFVFLSFTLNFAQTDWQRWGKVKDSYEKKVPDDTLKFDNSSVKSFLFSSLKNAYAFFWSDHDGDNCPFYPKCSRFYVTAVKETNLIKGTLMFADRFTRDSNLFKSSAQYGFYYTGRLFDPVIKYTLNQKPDDRIYPNA